MMEDTTTRMKATAETEAKRRAEAAKRELGDLILDATEDYFPAHVKQRRRRTLAKGFLLGIATALLAIYGTSRD